MAIALDSSPWFAATMMVAAGAYHTAPEGSVKERKGGDRQTRGKHWELCKMQPLQHQDSQKCCNLQMAMEVEASLQTGNAQKRQRSPTGTSPNRSPTIRSRSPQTAAVLPDDCFHWRLNPKARSTPKPKTLKEHQSTGGDLTKWPSLCVRLQQSRPAIRRH